VTLHPSLAKTGEGGEKEKKQSSCESFIGCFKKHTLHTREEGPTMKTHLENNTRGVRRRQKLRGGLNDRSQHVGPEPPAYYAKNQKKKRQTMSQTEAKVGGVAKKGSKSLKGSKRVGAGTKSWP